MGSTSPRWVGSTKRGSCHSSAGHHGARKRNKHRCRLTLAPVRLPVVRRSSIPLATPCATLPLCALAERRPRACRSTTRERRRFKPSFPGVPLARRTPCRPSESPLEASNPPLHPVLARSLDPGHTRPHDRSPHGSAATPPTPRRRLFAARSSSSTEVPGQAPEREPRSPRRGLGGSGARTPPR